MSAIAKLKTVYPNILYIIAGSGTELENLKNMTRDLDINNNVTFLGNINDNQKKYLFKKIQI